MIICKPGDLTDYFPRKSIFLAGPSLRVEPQFKDIRNFFGAITPWRQEALEYLKHNKFEDVVHVPEPFINDYQEQIEWEDRRLHEAAYGGVIVFWVPRDLSTLPGFTTNVEFGMWMASGYEIVLGYPEGAPKMRYLHYKAEKYGIPIFHKLEHTLDKALEWLEE